MGGLAILQHQIAELVVQCECNAVISKTGCWIGISGDAGGEELLLDFYSWIREAESLEGKVWLGWVHIGKSKRIFSETIWRASRWSLWLEQTVLDSPLHPLARVLALMKSQGPS